MRRQVALKVIKPGMDSCAVIARFQGERQALAMMDHPAIAQVFDTGTTAQSRPYFVMEFVAGVPITRSCDEQRLPMEARFELFTRVCHAVQHGGVASPKAIDFGIAKAIQGRLTEATMATAIEQFIGTPAYMSPEQA